MSDRIDRGSMVVPGRPALGDTVNCPGYRPLADYGLIGDCHVAPRVSKDGSVDWLCTPRSAD